MLYLARKLHLPSGCVLERHVVRVDEFEELQWYPFRTECQSMVLVDELYIFEENGVLKVRTVD